MGGDWFPLNKWDTLGWVFVSIATGLGFLPPFVSAYIPVDHPRLLLCAVAIICLSIGSILQGYSRQKEAEDIEEKISKSGEKTDSISVESHQEIVQSAHREGYYQGHHDGYQSGLERGIDLAKDLINNPTKDDSRSYITGKEEEENEDSTRKREVEDKETGGEKTKKEEQNPGLSSESEERLNELEREVERDFD